MDVAPTSRGLRPMGGRRVLQVLTRSVHIAAMGVVLGGCWMGLGHDPLSRAIWITVGSGLLLLALDVIKDAAVLHQVSGACVFLKLALLGAGNLWPRDRFGWYLAATLLAGIGSHLPGSWRHYSWWYRRELKP